MPKVIRKSNKVSKNRANKKTLKRTNKNKKNNSRSKVMRGGNSGGSYVLPPSYFGGKTDGYVSKSENLPGAVSQGIATSNGQYAGPNLYPSMAIARGGGCGCGKKSKSKTQHKSNIKQKKSRKSKSKNNKRH